MSEPEVLTFRCDDAAGFELRVLRARDGDFWLSVVPCQQDMEEERRLGVYAPCYTAAVRVRAPMLGGGSHRQLWEALAGLFTDHTHSPRAGRKEG